MRTAQSFGSIQRALTHRTYFEITGPWFFKKISFLLFGNKSGLFPLFFPKGLFFSRASLLSESYLKSALETGPPSSIPGLSGTRNGKGKHRKETTISTLSQPHPGPEQGYRSGAHTTRDGSGAMSAHARTDASGCAP